MVVEHGSNIFAREFSFALGLAISRAEAEYGYHANSPLVSTISHRYAGNNRMVTTKQYDLINRLTSIANGAFDSYAYGYNNANQRTNVVRADGRRGPQVDGMPATDSLESAYNCHPAR